MNFFNVILKSILIVCISQVQFSESAKILAIFPSPGPSQYILVQPYLKTLAARGHEVHVINAFPQKENIPNFHDIPVLKVHEYYEDAIKLSMQLLSKRQGMELRKMFFRNVSTDVLSNADVQQMMHSNIRFDLIIVEVLNIDALFGFAQHYNAPIIGVSSFGSSPEIDELVGNSSPVSYIPKTFQKLTDRMTFRQRLINLYDVSMELAYYHLFSLPDQVKIYKKYFPTAKVELQELRKNFSLILLNQHFSLSKPRPYVPSMIQVGGFQVPTETKPLPAEMAKFINESKNGVIYFSMGSNVKSKDFPKETLQMFLDVFATLKENVMWKFEEPNLPGKPDNVFISKWFPQTDILAQPKVKLFITHGGLLSTVEAIHHGKPIIAIPIFADQFLNAARAQDAGFALTLDIKTLNKKELKSTIESLLTDPSFSQNAMKISNRYHDQPMKPMDTAIYWTEYVLRHKGAPHMRVAAQDLNFIQYHSIDTMAVLFGVPILIIAIVCFVVCKLFKSLFGKKKHHGKVKRKQQ